MIKIIGHIKRVFFEILPALVFFYVMFQMLAVSKALILRQYGIVVPATAMATIGSLIIAKVVLITDRIPFLNLYPRKPLIYTVLLKTFVYSVATLAFLIAEELIRLSVKSGGMAAGWHKMSVETNWPAFWLREGWICLLIFLYASVMELTRVIGAERIRGIFFGAEK